MARNATNKSSAEPLWSVVEASDYLGVPVATLYKWRHLGIGPQVYRVGRHLRYDPAIIRQWLRDEAAA